MVDITHDVQPTSEVTTWQPRPWASVQKAVPSSIPEYHIVPDLNELDRQWRWAQPDLLEKYKHEVRTLANDPNICHAGETISKPRRVTQTEVVASAVSIIYARFPKLANSRVNPPLPRKPKRPRALSEIDVSTCFAAVPETQGQPKRSKKRQALEVLADEDPSSPPSVIPPTKRHRADSEKENDLGEVPAQPTQETFPYGLDMPMQKNLLTPMNVSRKQVSKEDDGPAPPPAKKVKLAMRNAAPTRPGLQAVSNMKSSDPQNVHSTSRLPSPDTQNEQATSVFMIEESTHPLPQDSFSDESSLFEEMMSQEAARMNIGGSARDSNATRYETGKPIMPTPLHSASLPSSWDCRPSARSSLATADMTDIASSTTAPRSLIIPFIRGIPPSMDAPNHLIPNIQSENRIVTCFRVAEALKLRSNAASTPLSIDCNGNKFSSVTVELYARIKLTYRSETTQVFVFEDIFFPNKPPYLRGVHQSWQQCKTDAASILGENVLQDAEGGHLCRAIVRLNTSVPRNLNEMIEGCVLSVRAADWGEIKHVRGIVDPKCLNVSISS